MPLLRQRNEAGFVILAQNDKYAAPSKRLPYYKDESTWRVARKRNRDAYTELTYQNELQMPAKYRRLLGYETCIYRDLALPGRHNKQPIPIWPVGGKQHVENFLDLPRTIRDRIYRLTLTTTSRSVYFTGFNHATFGYKSSGGLSPAILRLNSQTYREGRVVLYGHNKFIANAPKDLFQPTGLGGLGRSTTQYIRHLSFENACLVFPGNKKESSQMITAPILRMLRTYPGLCRLTNLTIRREVLRSDVDFGELLKHGTNASLMRAFSKKNEVLASVVEVWEAAAVRYTPFHVAIVEQDGSRFEHVETTRDTKEDVDAEEDKKSRRTSDLTSRWQSIYGAIYASETDETTRLGKEFPTEHSSEDGEEPYCRTSNWLRRNVVEVRLVRKSPCGLRLSEIDD